MLGGLGNLETIYNLRLIWRLLDGVAKSLTGHWFIPGEVRLSRRGLSLSNYCNADELITNAEYKLDLVLLETSGPFGASNDKKRPWTTLKLRMDYLLCCILLLTNTTMQISSCLRSWRFHLFMLLETKLDFGLWILLLPNCIS